MIALDGLPDLLMRLILAWEEPSFFNNPQLDIVTTIVREIRMNRENAIRVENKDGGIGIRIEGLKKETR